LSTEPLPAPAQPLASEPADNHDVLRDIIAPQVVSQPLIDVMNSSGETAHSVIFEINLLDPDGPRAARAKVLELIKRVVPGDEARNAVLRRNQIKDPTHPYVFAELTKTQLQAILQQDGDAAMKTDARGKAVSHRHRRAIHHCWDSPEVKPLTTISVRTVKADAALLSYSASGEGIVWAVLDSGVQSDHPHFELHGNLKLEPPLKSRSFIENEPDPVDGAPEVDTYGHGTHVAGIIAGQAKPDSKPKAALASVDSSGMVTEYHVADVDGIRGMAPRCKIMSLRVVDRNGSGDVISIINALEYIQQLNGYGQNIVIHGVNISAGYLPKVHGYASGQTPVCLEVDRLVRTGVVVVVAAGNTGYVLSAPVGQQELKPVMTFEAGQFLSVNDPGNAALAITVGSTHREKPHTYGVSFFSSKGPTADGRQKPDLVAPGEKIISCAAGAAAARVTKQNTVAAGEFQYVEDTGTSMAAPHVSGIIAAFLSIRREFIGRPTDLSRMLMSTATDLGRDSRLQGAGMVDLMRLIASV
jgi:serine protease AprX